jgi:hypothetical protein
MKSQYGTTVADRHAASAQQETSSGISQAYASRKLTFGENVILTAKVLVTVALIGAALWAANLWTSAS